MKFDNRGWGLGVFLGFVVVLLLCILIAGINAYKLGLSSSSPKHYFDYEVESTPSGNTSTTDYNALEKAVQGAAEKYKNDRYADLSSGSNVVVTFQDLVRDGYMSSIVSCSGYVNIEQIDDSTSYQVFFHCPDHITSGYNSKLDQQ